MKYKLTKQKNEVTIAFEATAEEWSASIDKAYQATKHKFSVPGFRKGKAPKSFITRMYGESVFFDDAFDRLFGETYEEVLSKNAELKPVANPDIKVDELSETGVKYTAVVTVEPEVVLGDYKALTLKHAAHKVTEKDVNEEVKRACERAARRVDVTDRAAAEGDIVNIDYSGSMGENAFEGGTAQGQELKLGSKQYIPGFEEQIPGMKVGEDKEISVKFPDDYPAKDLAGKDAIFRIHLNAIKALEIPKADDAFAQDVSKFDTIAEYRADVRKRLEEAAKNRNKQDDENAVLEAVAKLAKIDLPEVMIQRQIDLYLRDIEYRMMMQGMTMEDYLKYADTTIEEMRKARRDDAVRALKTRLAVEKIIEKEKINVTQKAYDARVTEMAAAAKQEPAQFAQENAERLKMVYNEMLMDKVVDKLMSWTEWTDTAKKPSAKADEGSKKSDADKPTEEKVSE